MTILSPFSHTHLKLCQAVLLLQYSRDAGKEWAACNITCLCLLLLLLLLLLPLFLVTVCLANDIDLTIASA